MSILTAHIAVKVVPGASRSEIVGWQEDTLRVRIAAPPERGKANAALIELLAQTLGVSKRSVSVISGHTQSRKRVEIIGVSAEDVRSQLAGADC
jgi:uncharacterized protein